MRLGFCLPQHGRAAGPEALVSVAQRAEALGFESLWVAERLLWPLDPQTPYPASSDGRLPEGAKCQLDPLESLTFVAAHTSRVRLGTSVINLPFHNPLVLARRFATLDVLSGGRACVGLGNGWSADEFEAVGVAAQGRGKRIDEALTILKAVWTDDPIEFEGEFFRIPRSFVQPKPVQKPHPPIYYAAFAPAAMRRVALGADGWNPAGLPPAAMGAMFQSTGGSRERGDRRPAASRKPHGVHGGPGSDRGRHRRNAGSRCRRDPLRCPAIEKHPLDRRPDGRGRAAPGAGEARLKRAVADLTPFFPGARTWKRPGRFDRGAPKYRR
jgi:probable F420-dependent oxidoreductase